MTPVVAARLLRNKSPAVSLPRNVALPNAAETVDFPQNLSLAMRTVAVMAHQPLLTSVGLVLQPSVPFAIVLPSGGFTPDNNIVAALRVRMLDS